MTKTNPRTAKNRVNDGSKDSNLEALRPIWQGRQDLNLQPTVLETATLPIELLPYTVRKLLTYKG